MPGVEEVDGADAWLHLSGIPDGPACVSGGLRWEGSAEKSG